LLGLAQKRPLIVLGILGFLGVSSWPVSGWLAAAIAIAVIFSLLKRKLLGAYPELTPLGAMRTFFGLIAASIAHTAKYVAYGIAIVTATQLTAVLFSKLLTPERLAWGEEQLSLTFQAVSGLLSFEHFLVFIGLFLLANLILPFSGLVNKFLYAKSLLSRALFILIGATSFSFFSTEAVRLRDPEWRKAEYGRARIILTDIAVINRETMAAAWLEKQVKAASPETAQDYKNFFNSANSLRYPASSINLGEALSDYKTEVVRDAGRSVARNAPKIDQVPSSSASQLTFDRELMALEAKTAPSASTQALAELRRSNEKLAAAKARYEAIRRAAVATASEALAQLMPQSEHVLVRAFVEEVTSSVARNALESLKPYFPAEPAAAKSWIETVAPARTGGAAAGQEWKIALRPLAQVSSGPSSEIAMSLLAAQLQTRAALRAAEMRRFMTPPSFHSAPRIRTVPRVRFRF
jgi:hypothetical protein